MSLLLLRVIRNVFCEHLYGNIRSVRHMWQQFLLHSKKENYKKYFNFIEKLHSNLAPSRRVLSTVLVEGLSTESSYVRRCLKVRKQQHWNTNTSWFHVTMGTTPKGHISLWSLSPMGELPQPRDINRLFWKAVQIRKPAPAQRSLHHPDKFSHCEYPSYIQISFFSCNYFAQNHVEHYASFVFFQCALFSFP